MSLRKVQTASSDPRNPEAEGTFSMIVLSDEELKTWGRSLVAGSKVSIRGTLKSAADDRGVIIITLTNVRLAE